MSRFVCPVSIATSMAFSFAPAVPRALQLVPPKTYSVTVLTPAASSKARRRSASANIRATMSFPPQASRAPATSSARSDSEMPGISVGFLSLIIFSFFDERTHQGDRKMKKPLQVSNGIRVHGFVIFKDPLGSSPIRQPRSRLTIAPWPPLGLGRRIRATATRTSLDAFTQRTVI